MVFLRHGFLFGEEIQLLLKTAITFTVVWKGFSFFKILGFSTMTLCSCILPFHFPLCHVSLCQSPLSLQPVHLLLPSEPDIGPILTCTAFCSHFAHCWVTADRDLSAQTEGLVTSGKINRLPCVLAHVYRPGGERQTERWKSRAANDNELVCAPVCVCVYYIFLIFYS